MVDKNKAFRGFSSLKTSFLCLLAWRLVTSSLLKMTFAYLYITQSSNRISPDYGDAVTTVVADWLERVWKQLEYRVDVSLVS